MQELHKTQAEINWDDILPRLMLFSLRLIRSRHLEERVSAEEIAHRAIERSIKHGKPIKDYLYFLMAAARSIVSDEIRKKHEEAELAQTGPATFVDPLDDIQTELEREEHMEALTAALGEIAHGDDKLAEMTKALMDDPSLPTREIAARLGVPLHEVFFLKKRLQKRLLMAIA